MLDCLPISHPWWVLCRLPDLDPMQLGLPKAAPLTTLIWTTVSCWILFFRDIENFTEVVNDRMQAIDGVVSTESFFVLEAHKLACGWGVGNVPGPSESEH